MTRAARLLAPLLASCLLLPACGGGDTGEGDAPGGDDGGDGGATAPEALPQFPSGSVWDEDVSEADVDAESEAVISGLEALGGWGTGEMRIDFSFEVLAADDSTPLRSFEPNADFFEGECDQVAMPVPAGGAIEAEEGYECTSNGDCHLIVVQQDTHQLYEMWRADISGDSFSGGCVAVWDLDRVYPATGRGEGCTSADAAGYPIAPLLFSADEIAAGEIQHAIRFILPNPRIREGAYVHPATHSTVSAAGGAGTPPYGARLRLRADYPLQDLPSEGARVIARAMQKYGILLADGGDIALTAQSDRFTAHKWDEVGVDSHDLVDIQVSDFAMIDGGTRYPWPPLDCVRNTF